MKCALLRHLLPARGTGPWLALALCAGGVHATPVSDPTSLAQALRQEAQRYRALVPRWEPLHLTRSLRPGEKSEAVAQLRRQLQLYGDYRGLPGPLSAPQQDLLRYDAGLQLAVESYQYRHGLPVNGIAGTETLRELAVSPQQRARQLELNADRWQKLPSKKESRYILVNVPEYHLHLVEDGQITLSMKTVVGKTSSRTPDMKGRITNIVFNPTWTVPRSILLTELLPKARNNPEAMHNRGYRVVAYRSGKTALISDDSLSRAARGKATLRQISGAGNSLGRVKFVFPNRQAIFLHDTQAQSLFSHPRRAYSHGCVRLEQPEELAYALLDEQGWDRTRVAQATTGSEPVNIRIEKPVRLFITYMTAWLGRDGKIHFRPDIYHRDRPGAD